MNSPNPPNKPYYMCSTLSPSNDYLSNKNSARILGSGIAGLSELLLFHPVDTITKRLMTTQNNYVVPGKTLSNLNVVIFRDAADRSMGRKFFSLFPGLGFAAGYKISQRIYKFGGQPYVKDYLDKHVGHQFRSQFGEKRGKSLMSATAGSIIGMGEVLLLPLDVLKIKAQTNPAALQSAGGLVSLLAKEGTKLYAGAGEINKINWLELLQPLLDTHICVCVCLSG
jgi:hypothetical protein